MKTCFFIGHREAPESLAALLEEAIERHICQLGVTEFVVGSYGEFDRMAIAYVRYTASNSRELLEYARRLEAKGALRVENLADKIEK